MSARRRVPLVVATLACACGGGTPAPILVEDASAPGGLLFPSSGGERPICQEVTYRLDFEPKPADVLVLFDRSGSMGAGFGAGTRYSEEARVLGELVSVYQHRLRFGFQAFPGPEPCQNGEAPGCCAGEPQVDVGFGNAAAIGRAITAAAPVAGSTPTAGTLARAREYFSQQPDPLEQRYVLLSTDGRPSCDAAGALSDSDVLDEQGRRVGGACYDALRATDALVKDGIKVIVLGVGPLPENDPGSGSGCLEDIAARGGAARDDGPPAFFSGSDPERLEQALQRIFGGASRPSCLLTLLAPPPDPTRVAVFMDGRQVPRRRDHGWDWETPGDFQRLRLHGGFCRRLDRFQVTTVEVRYGCAPCQEGVPCE